MDKQPTEAQIKEVWEWCGLKVSQSADGYLMLKNEKGHTSWIDLDLNNLFKHAVPKLWVCSLDLEEGIFWVAKTGSPELGDGKVHSAVNEDPALALFWAIWEVKP